MAGRGLLRTDPLAGAGPASAERRSSVSVYIDTSFHQWNSASRRMGSLQGSQPPQNTTFMTDDAPTPRLRSSATPPPSSTPDPVGSTTLPGAVGEKTSHNFNVCQPMSPPVPYGSNAASAGAPGRAKAPGLALGRAGRATGRPHPKPQKADPGVSPGPRTPARAPETPPIPGQFGCKAQSAWPGRKSCTSRAQRQGENELLFYEAPRVVRN